jgi:fructose-bisphosphate aldolase, class I
MEDASDNSEGVQLILNASGRHANFRSSGGRRKASICSPDPAGFAKKGDRAFAGSGAPPTARKEQPMELSEPVKRILSYYESDNPGTKANLARILLHGKLGGTGRLLILPVDQGVEHGPARSFAPNPPAYDPHYHYQLAIDAGLSAYAAPLGFLEAGADTFAGRVPTILKLNNANSMSRFKENASQAVTANVKDALRLGCSAIGYTIYPGSDAAYDQMRDIAEMACEAKAYGLAVVIWSYPRGGNLSREGETAIDISAYAAQIAAQLGAHIIKVKPPTAHLELAAAKKVYEERDIDISTPAARIRHVVQSAFNGRRIVVFSGGEAKDLDGVFGEVRAVRDGGGNGSIIGRNTFQRSKKDAIDMLSKIVKIYQGKD